MGPIGRKKRQLEKEEYDERFWRYVLPVALLVPGYGLVAVKPTWSLIYIGALLIPIGIAGGILGEDRRAENAAAQVSLGKTDYGHGDADDKIGDTSYLSEFGANLGLLGFASFVLIAVLFV